MSAFILCLSAILQFTAALLSVRLINETGRWKAWSLIAAAMTLMGVRRSITLYRTLTEGSVYSADLTAELVALTISVLMVLGVYFIGPIFKKIKSINAALQESEERFRIASYLSYDILWEWDIVAGIHNWFGDIDKQLGYKPGEFPRTIDAWQSVIHPEDRDRVVNNLDKNLKVHTSWREEYRIVRKDGDIRYWDARGETRWGDDKALTMIGAIIDITERKKTEKILSYQATHDALTGLVNRREFERRVERLLSLFEHNVDEHALCYLDLDQFKVINDTCGHAAGDEMLRQLGLMLKQTIRHRDTLARLGGDEFGILMEHCSLDDAHRVVNAIQKAIRDYHFSWDGHKFKVGVSIGLVPVKENITNLTDLLSFADTACYQAKENGRNRIHVYHADDKDIAIRHGEMQWVERINQALEDDLYCIYAQEILSIENYTDKHYELLIRMYGEKGEIIPPGSFLVAAERYNIISKIDRWMVKNTFKLLVDHPVAFNNINLISINLSGQSLADEDFQLFVVKQMMNSEIKPEKICFEITETAAISNLKVANQFISKMKVLGCQFALDDFGSGLSSFGYLKNLPVNYLKIDGMFVKDVADDPIDYAMVKSINEIGHVMGMKTIAEFVENDEIKNILKEIGVDYVQGYGIGKPEPFKELLAGVSDISNVRNIQDAKKNN